MRNFKVLTAVLITLFSVSVKTFAQVPLSNQAQISLLTCGPGKELYSVFGHTAIRVYDPASGMDVVYNFGTFDFDTPNFYGKFVKGDLQYFVSASSYNDFVYTYQYYNRDVFEQWLNLTQQQKQDIANELNERLNGPEKYYTYKFIHRNCTTMVADIINKYLPEKISLKNEDNGLTYREIIYDKLQEDHFFENLGIHLTFGSPTDNMSAKSFLPKELMQGVSNTAAANGPLAKSTHTVYKATPEEKGFSLNSFIVFAVAMLALLALSSKTLVQRSLLAVAGLMGLFFCIAGLYSLHSELIWNYNALLMNPVALVLLCFIFTNKPKAILGTSYAYLACIGIYIILMLNKPHLLIVLPLLVLMVAMLACIILSYRKRTA